MTQKEENYQNLVYFKMNLLQAEIEMQGMIAENKIQELKGEPLYYNEVSFKSLINKYDIHHNKFPFIKV
jgi:hypothetical protein